MKLQPLSSWIKGNQSITPTNFFSKNNPCFELGGFITLDIAEELYRANTVETNNLYDSWIKHKKYIEDVFAFINANRLEDILDLDNEEKYYVLKELGEPPFCCYNLYFITIYNNHEEKLVYIGKTNCKTNRFANGHLAALKLHNPIYKEYNKRIYFGTITFLSKDKEYIPLEFIYPYKKAEKYLNDIEALLISHFKPELNVKSENMHLIDDISLMHIQNSSNVPDFLHDYMVFA